MIIKSHSNCNNKKSAREGAAFLRINGYCWLCKNIKDGCKYKFEIKSEPSVNDYSKVVVKTIGEHNHGKTIRKLDANIKIMKIKTILVKKKKSEKKRKIKNEISLDCMHCLRDGQLNKCCKCRNQFHNECNEEKLKTLLKVGESSIVKRCIKCYFKIAPEKFI